MAVVAIVDYLLQYQQWYERQKMSLRELKDEFKDTEGDPKIKARVRQIRQNRMKKAHDGGGAEGDGGDHQPDPLRRGAELRARHECAGLRRQGRRPRGAAGSGKSPPNTTFRVVENPPLARTLHATVEIDEEIPPEHYKAVAEVIGYVMRLTRAIAP